MPESSVKSFYKDKKIFLTGGTGFVGLAVVEKLLRTTEVNRLYLLIRPKKGKEAAERLQEFCKNPVFDRLIKEKGEEVFGKLTAVGGDVGTDRLGISEEDRALLRDNVNVIIHSAATLDFEADLRETTKINLQGTRRVVELAKEIKHLAALVHVSSAYVNSHLTEVKEAYYKVPQEADTVIERVTKCEDKDLEELTTELLGEYVNTYTFTKALAEEEVTASITSFPSCIVRPSQIVAAWREPVEGWTCSKNGPQGFLLGTGKGVIRRLPVDDSIIADYIPVDIVVNGILVGAWHAALTRPAETPVFHLTSSTANPFRWNQITPVMNEMIHRYPMKSAVWYPTLKLHPSLFMFRIAALFFHWIPAIILDTATRLTGGRPILVKLHTNVDRSVGRLEKFIFTEWKFDSSRALALHKSLDPEDQETFGLDITSLDWCQFFDRMAHGIRTYLANEKPESLEAARRKNRKLKLLNYLLMASILLLQLGIVSLFFGLQKAALSLPLLFIFYNLF